MAVFYVNVSVGNGSHLSGTPNRLVVSRGSTQAGGVTVAVDTSLITTQGQLRHALAAAFDHIVASATDMGIK